MPTRKPIILSTQTSSVTGISYSIEYNPQTHEHQCTIGEKTYSHDSYIEVLRWAAATADAGESALAWTAIILITTTSRMAARENWNVPSVPTRR